MLMRKAKSALKNAKGKRELVQLNKVYSLDGPGRASGNSLNTLLDAYLLSGLDKYIDLAEELVRRCIHPQDDVVKRDLLDAENRWMYTIFLQALGKYLDVKTGEGKFDSMWHYGCKSLINYAKWMADNEYPYLTKPDKLEFPNETWAAQDLRKCNVFLFAARYCDHDLRQVFFEKADFFYNDCVERLDQYETKNLTRPIVLSMQNGMMYGVRHKLLLEGFVNPQQYLGDHNSSENCRNIQRVFWLRNLRMLLKNELQFVRFRIIKKNIK